MGAISQEVTQVNQLLVAKFGLKIISVAVNYRYRRYKSI